MLPKLSTLVGASILTACSSLPTPEPSTQPSHQDFVKQYSENRYTIKTLYSCAPGQVFAEEHYAALHYSDLWQLVRDDFKLDDQLQRPQVQAQLKRYLKHPHNIERISQRAEPYLYHITQQIEERNMPMELALLPIVESAYDPFAYSHGRAAGMWQFIPSTGKIFGLKQDWWYDGRRDVLSSTDAALSYLSQLAHRYNGDWALALAAYNAGIGTVNRAIRKNKKAGLPTDYWSLPLPKETKSYMPKLLALAEIFKHPDRYNIDLKAIDNKPYFAVVHVGSQIDLAQAATMAGIKLDELYQLNPAFNRWATDPKGNHELLIPVNAVEQFNSALAELDPEERVSWQRYTIRSGDSLGLIAQRHDTSVSVLQTVNKLDDSVIKTGNILMIPLTKSAVETYAVSDTQRRISKNNQSPSTGIKNYHTVAQGDSLWVIARENKVNTRQLASWNNMAPGDTLSVGKKLVIWQQDANASKTTKSVGYKVRSGDSLAKIANRYSVKINDIARWNNLDKNRYIQPGQKLKLYVDVTNLR